MSETKPAAARISCPGFAAAKNKKRREAAKKKKEDEATTTMNNSNAVPNVQGSLNNVATQSGKCDTSGSLSKDPEAEKILRKLNDKLIAIQKLKQQQKEEKQIEKNQLEKISKEKEITMEIKNLKI